MDEELEADLAQYPKGGSGLSFESFTEH